MIKLHDILKRHIPGKEIRARIQMNIIKVDNEVVYDINKEIDISPADQGTELGEFLFNAIKSKKIIDSVAFNPIFNIKDFFGPGNTNIYPLKFLEDYRLISVSKNTHFVYKRLKILECSYFSRASF